MKTPPKWAQEIIIDACIYLNIELPDVTWQKRKWDDGTLRPGHSGTAWSKSYRITIRQGITDTPKRLNLLKVVVLHELAHLTHPKEHHSLEFWRTAKRLYEWAGLNMIQARVNEVAYRKTALKVFKGD